MLSKECHFVDLTLPGHMISQSSGSLGNTFPDLVVTIV